MTPTQTTTFQAAFSGAVLTGTLGAAYGYVSARGRVAKQDDAQRYGLLFGVLGALAGVYLVNSTPAAAATNPPT